MLRACMNDDVCDANAWVIEAYHIRLEPVTLSHLAQLRQWRNSPEIREHMLNQQIITDTQQRQWFDRIRQDPRERHWVIRYRQSLIGAINIKCGDAYASLAHASCLWPGLYIGEPRYQGNLIAFAPTLALYDFCFSRLSVNLMQATVKQNNVAAIKYNHSLGYETQQGADGILHLNLTQDAYEVAAQSFKRILSRK